LRIFSCAWKTIGDDIARGFHLMISVVIMRLGAIVLAMAMTKTRSILLVSMLTRLPQDFVAFIITKWLRNEEELERHMRDTEACVAAQFVDYIDLHESLDYTVERFWMLADPDENSCLNDLRGGYW
jgi:hypothetical protein